jgi:hypothetical protein
VDLALAMSPTAKCMGLLLFSGVAAPLAGVLFRRVAGGWDSIGKGPLAIDPDLPQGRAKELFSPASSAVQEAEARQMIEAKSYRRRMRGEEPLDVEAELSRALAEGSGAPLGAEKMRAELRAEIRQLVVARNERRLRRGEQPLDVEAETDRRLTDCVGSS